MPKRKHKDSDSNDYLLRKLKKIERKIQKRSRKLSSSSSSDNSVAALSLQEDNQPDVSEDAPVITDSIDDAMSNIQSPSIELSQLDMTSTSVENSDTQIALDDNILNLLGETPSKSKNYSSPIQSELAVRWEHIATSGLKKEIKKDILDKYLLSENCLRVGSPQLNPEIRAALSDTLVKKDKAIEVKQNQLAIAITCISQALTKMFASQDKDTDVIKFLLDGVRLLCDYQYVESMSRRSFVTSTIKKEIKDHLYTTNIDNFLFGEKLADTLKAAKAINKSGAEMKTASQPRSAVSQPKPNQPRSLNVRPPLPLARQPGAGRRLAPTAQQPRRYEAPVPPPPQPLPPPPPPYRAPPPMQPQRSRGRTLTRR